MQRTPPIRAVHQCVRAILWLRDSLSPDVARLIAGTLRLVYELADMRVSLAVRCVFNKTMLALRFQGGMLFNVLDEQSDLHVRRAVFASVMRRFALWLASEIVDPRPETRCIEVVPHKSGMIEVVLNRGGDCWLETANLRRAARQWSTAFQLHVYEG